MAPRNPFATMDTSTQSGELSEACTSLNLTRKQRLIGFGCCFGAGFIISALSFLSLSLGQIVTFAIFYTVGNITSLLSTSFLIGFKSQLKGMFDKRRRIASFVYVGSMAGTIFVALFTGLAGLCLICSAVQFLALFWYSISYIPFGRDVVKKAVGIA